MQRSSELVVALAGSDPSEHMMELVFGDFEREYTQTGAPRPSSSALGQAVSSMVRKIAPSPRRRSPGSGGGGSGGGSRPSLSRNSFSSRLQSGFRSLLGSSQQHETGSGWGGGMVDRSGSFSSMASVALARNTGGDM